MNYSDIDLSFVNTTKNDIGIISGLSNCVRNSIVNLLQISTKEVPFSNEYRPSLADVIHSTDVLTFELQVNDLFEYIAKRDTRVQKITNVSIVRQDDYELVISLTLKLRNMQDLQTFTFKIEKR